VTKDIDDSLEVHTELVQMQLTKMINAATLPSTLSSELTKKLSEIIKAMLKNINDWDQIHFQATKKHMDAVLLLQTT